MPSALMQSVVQRDVALRSTSGFLSSALTTVAVLVAVMAAIVFAPAARAQDSTGDAAVDSSQWQKALGLIPIQDGGRLMPLDTFARRLAVDLTGRATWREGKGPEGFSGRPAIELFADLIARPQEVFRSPLIAINHEELKREIGFDPDRKFFSPQEIMRAEPLHQLVGAMRERMAEDSNAKPSAIERKAAKVQNAAMAVAMFQRDRQFPLIPRTDSEIYATVGTATAEPGYEDVQAALWDFRTAYLTGDDVLGAVRNLESTIADHASTSESLARNVRLEYFYNHHRPWIWAAVANGVALLCLIGFAVTRLKLFAVLAGVAIAAALGEQFLGLWLRIDILDRAPVSNTYEAVLWMGIVSTLFGLVGQAFNRKGLYLAAGLVASMLCIIFSQLVPLTDQTNSIPAVLRSNYWLIIHVMTIVASYGAFLLAAVLGHTFLIRDVVLRRPADPNARLIVQTYRLIQLGLVLLTVGTILGGVWAAESWGRFWGWDPKETWALISIVLYFLVLHARYSGWIRDFGLAVLSVIGFISIVWTFYGVNYVMAAGLHSYGFGSGGEKWVGLWALGEVLFLALCFTRRKASSAQRAEAERSEEHEVAQSETAPPDESAPSTA
ncbi:MAG: cytochrome c biogenesis protein CcsA [Planctomycetota bacterium]|nr:cytochrome c biogenesis protein CcsA [Planctomycetota bacterium]